MSLYTQLFYSKEIDTLFSDAESITQMLRVEATLAEAQANKGLFSKAVAKTIKASCTVSEIDIEKDGAIAWRKCSHSFGKTIDSNNEK